MRTELHYTEFLVPRRASTNSVYPTVVGPRYSNQPISSAPPSERWTQNPYLHEGNAPITCSTSKPVWMRASHPGNELPLHKVNISIATRPTLQSIWTRLKSSRETGILSWIPACRGTCRVGTAAFRG